MHKLRRATKQVPIADPKLREAGESGYSQLAMWFRERLDDAIQAAEEEKSSHGTSLFPDGEWTWEAPQT